MLRFRWVECQFESLKRCPRSENHLERCLQSLPRSLDETYERILCSIDEGLVGDARRILTLLCFSSRPLTVQELIDGVAIDLHEPARLNPQRRLQDADDLREICPGLIDVSVKVNDKTQMTFRIAHFSVQEYLEFDCIKHQKAAAFALDSASAHAEIAEICLICLLEPELSSGLFDKTKLMEFPLARFAALFWHHHYINAAATISRLDSLILRMFQQQQGSFYTWVKLYNPDTLWGTNANFSSTQTGIASPVYYASLLGLDGVLQQLIDICQDNRKDLVNAQGGELGNALQAASYGGHEKVVQILVDTGADVNAQDGQWGNALQAASREGREKVVQILMDAGADVNAQGGFWGNALQVASAGGHEKVVQMLIDAGADVSAEEGSTLQAASEGGHEKVVRILMDAGADVNAQGGTWGNALQAASEAGEGKVVQMLIDAGADVNAQGGEWGNALRAASVRGHEKVVQMLIDAGAVERA